MSDGRADILGRLRLALGAREARLDRREAPRPAAVIDVPEGRRDPHALTARFGESLVALSGSYEVVRHADEVAERAAERITTWSAHDSREDDGDGRRRDPEILSWAPDQLTPPDLGPQLERAGITLVVPEELGHRDTRLRLASLRIGLTGVDAAIASTGSVLMAAGPGRSRVASLLPTHHLMIVAASHVYPTLEDWFQELRRGGLHAQRLRQPGQIIFVSGPSKSADIELNLTLGVHGPRTTHAIIYDDAER